MTNSHNFSAARNILNTNFCLCITYFFLYFFNTLFILLVSHWLFLENFNFQLFGISFQLVLSQSDCNLTQKCFSRGEICVEIWKKTGSDNNCCGCWSEQLWDYLLCLVIIFMIWRGVKVTHESIYSVGVL